MPIKPVGPIVKSQDINDNLAFLKDYTDEKISTVNGGPKGIYATLAALQAAFPIGDRNIYIIQADGKWYFWNGTAWTVGGQYQSTGIADKSVTSAKRTSIGETLRIIKGANAMPNYNPTTKILTIYNNTLIIFRTQSYVLSSNVAIDCVDIGVTSENVKVLFNVETKVFRAVWYSTAPSEDEIIVCTVKTNVYPYIMDASFLFTVDGNYPSYPVTSDKVLDIAPLWKQTTLLTSGNYPSVNNATKKLIFPGGGYSFIFYVGETAYSDVMTLSNLEIDLSVATGSSAWGVLLNLTTKQFEVKVWSAIQTFKATHALFATFRIIDGKYHFNMSCPFYVDGKLYGVNYTTPTEVQTMIDGASGTTAIKHNPRDANIKAIAHRGYSIDAPENTLPAYELAKKKGFSYVECDVLWSGDGVPVVIHDNTIDRTSDGTGAVDSLTLAQLKTYDFGSWKNAKYVGTKIPTFEEFIVLCKKLDLHPYIEIKSVINPSQAAILVNIVKKLGMLRKVSWISFTLADLVNILNIDEKARVGYVTMSTTTTKIDQAVAIKSDDNDVFINMHSVDVTSTLVEYAHENGIDAETWTVNHESVVIDLANMGIDGISTDVLNIAEILST